MHWIRKVDTGGLKTKKRPPPCVRSIFKTSPVKETMKGWEYARSPSTVQTSNGSDLAGSGQFQICEEGRSRRKKRFHGVAAGIAGSGEAEKRRKNGPVLIFSL
jgi:hypothetical protein